MCDKSALYKTLSREALIAIVTGNRQLKREIACFFAMLVTGFPPLLLFLNYGMSDCGRWRYVWAYDTALLRVTLFTMIIAFVQGVIGRTRCHFHVHILSGILVALLFLISVQNLEKQFSLNILFARGCEFFMERGILLYLATMLPLIGPLMAYWGRRWDAQGRRIIELAPPVALTTLIIAAFVHCQYL